VTIQFPKWQISASLLERACFPERARQRAEKQAEAITLAYLQKLRAEGKTLQLKPGDSFEVDGVRYEFA